MRHPDTDPDHRPDHGTGAPGEQSCRVKLPDGAGVVTLRVPGDWQVVPDLPDRVPLVAAGPFDEWADLRSTLVVTLERLADGVGLDDWQRPVDALQARQFDRYGLLDLERVEVAGRPGARRLATYLGPRQVSVTMAQWMVLAGRAGWRSTPPWSSPSASSTLEGEPWRSVGSPAGRVGVTVTASCATATYPASRPISERAIASLTIGDEPRTGAGER